MADLNSLKTEIKGTVPRRIYNQIPFDSWDQSSTRDSVYTRAKLALHPELLESYPSYSKAQIFEKYKKYLKNAPGLEVRPHSLPSSPPSRMDPEYLCKMYEWDLRQIAKGLEIFFNKEAKQLARVEAYIELRRLYLFRTTGSGFLLSVVPSEQAAKLEKIVFFSLEMQSQNHHRLDYAFGDRHENDFYSKILYVLSILDNQGYDLRLESESISARRHGLL